MAPAAAIAATMASPLPARHPNTPAAFALPRASPSRTSATSGSMAPAAAIAATMASLPAASCCNALAAFALPCASPSRTSTTCGSMRAAAFSASLGPPGTCIFPWVHMRASASGGHVVNTRVSPQCMQNRVADLLRVSCVPASPTLESRHPAPAHPPGLKRAADKGLDVGDSIHKLLARWI